MGNAHLTKHLYKISSNIENSEYKLNNLNVISEVEQLQQKLQSKLDLFGIKYDLPIDLEAEKLNKIAADAEINTELERLKREVQDRKGINRSNTHNQNSDRQSEQDKDKINLCYSIFGLKPDASLIEVKQAHRKLIKKHHPDLFFDNPQRQHQAEEMMKKINKAYTKICFYIKERSHL